MKDITGKPTALPHLPHTSREGLPSRHYILRNALFLGQNPPLFSSFDTQHLFNPLGTALRSQLAETSQSTIRTLLSSRRLDKVRDTDALPAILGGVGPTPSPSIRVPNSSLRITTTKLPEGRSPTMEELDELSAWVPLPPSRRGPGKTQRASLKESRLVPVRPVRFLAAQCEGLRVRMPMGSEKLSLGLLSPEKGQILKPVKTVASLLGSRVYIPAEGSAAPPVLPRLVPVSVPAERPISAEPKRCSEERENLSSE